MPATLGQSASGSRYAGWRKWTGLESLPYELNPEELDLELDLFLVD